MAVCVRVSFLKNFYTFGRRLRVCREKLFRQLVAIKATLSQGEFFFLQKVSVCECRVCVSFLNGKERKKEKGLKSCNEFECRPHVVWVT
jgi:hypothetical protein